VYSVIELLVMPVPNEPGIVVRVGVPCCACQRMEHLVLASAAITKTVPGDLAPTCRVCAGWFCRLLHQPQQWVALALPVVQCIRYLLLVRQQCRCNIGWRMSAHSHLRACVCQMVGPRACLGAYVG
jgi:hypothetical protein